MLSRRTLQAVYNQADQLADADLRALMAQQAVMADPFWRASHHAFVRGLKAIGVWEHCDRVLVWTVPGLSGTSWKIDLKIPATGRTLDLSADNADFEQGEGRGVRLLNGAFFTAAHVFADANCHFVGTFFNSSFKDDRNGGEDSARGGGFIAVCPQINGARLSRIRSGATTYKKISNESAFGWIGMARYDADEIGILIRDQVNRQALPATIAPTGAFQYGMATEKSPPNQHERVFSLEADGWAPTDAQSAAIHQLGVQLVQDLGIAWEEDPPPAIGANWYTRADLARMSDPDWVILWRGSPRRYNDEVSPYDPVNAVQTQVAADDADVATWLQDVDEVFLRIWANREKDLAPPGDPGDKKPNGIDGVGRTNGNPSRVDYPTRQRSKLANLAAARYAFDASDAEVLGTFTEADPPWDVGTALDDLPGGGKVFTPGYAEANKDAIFTTTRLGYAVNDVDDPEKQYAFMPPGRASQVPNGKCVVINWDYEIRNGQTGEEFFDEATAFSDDGQLRGYKNRFGNNPLQNSPASGLVAPYVFLAALLPGTAFINIGADAGVTDSYAGLQGEWAICLGPNGEDPRHCDMEGNPVEEDDPAPRLSRKFLISISAGYFAYKSNAVTRGRAINQFAMDYNTGGFAWIPAYGNVLDEDMQRFKAAVLGLPAIDEPGYEPPPPPPTDAEDFFFADGADPEGITISTGAGKRVFDADGLLIAVPANTGRYDHDHSGNPLGLVIEQGATNIVTYSDQFGAAFWTVTARTKIGVTDGHPDPIGTTTADKLAVATTASGTHEVQTAGAVALTNGTWYTQSIFMEKAEIGFGCLAMSDTVSNRRFFFDLTTGAISTTTIGIRATIRQVSDGPMWRLSNSFPAVGNGSVTPNFQIATSLTSANFAGTVDEGAWIWGAQITETDCVLLPIPTAGSTVTVAADDIGINSTRILAATALYWRGQAAYGHGWKKQYLWSIFNGTTLWEAYRDTDATIHVRTWVAGTMTSDIQLEAVADGAVFAVAARMAASDFAAILSSHSIHTSTGVNGGAIPTGMTSAYLGRDSADDNYLNRTVYTLQGKVTGRTDQQLIDAVTDYAGFAAGE